MFFHRGIVAACEPDSTTLNTRSSAVSVLAIAGRVSEVGYAHNNLVVLSEGGAGVDRDRHSFYIFHAAPHFVNSELDCFLS